MDIIACLIIASIINFLLTRYQNKKNMMEIKKDILTKYGDKND